MKFIQEPEPRQSLASLVFAYAIGKIAVLISEPAKAELPDASNCSENGSAEVLILGAQGAASLATERALDQLNLAPNEDPRRMPVALQCYPSEAKQDCEERAKALFAARLERFTSRLGQNAIENVELNRARRFVELGQPARRKPGVKLPASSGMFGGAGNEPAQRWLNDK